MKRAIVLGVVIAAGALSMALAAYQQPAGGQQAPVVQVDKVKDNLYMLKGGGGNTAVFVQTNGVTVVDTKNPGWGQPILDKIKELTSKPVTMIINTHSHNDHVSGNVEFPATVDVVVQENTLANMKKMVPALGGSVPPGTPSIFDQHQGRGQAKRSFKDRMTLGSGADEIDLFYFGRGHTNGDAWVLFPALRVLHAGDLLSKSVPLLDTNNGGSGVDLPDTLTKGHAALSKSADTIITGHNPTVMTMNELIEYASFNRDFLEAVHEAKKAGKTVDEISRTWTIPSKYVGYAAPQPDRLRNNVQAVWDELK